MMSRCTCGIPDSPNDLGPRDPACPIHGSVQIAKRRWAEQCLARLEAEMNVLVGDRNEKVQTGQIIINRANQQFDEAALPLARQINALRDQLEATKATPPPPALPRQKRYPAPDPDWTPEDIAHYHELIQR